MNNDPQRAVLTVCLMAAFADGGNSERERDEIRKIAERLGAGTPIDVGALYQDVLTAPPSLQAIAGSLPAVEQRQSPTRWPYACATPTARRRRRSANS